MHLKYLFNVVIQYMETDKVTLTEYLPTNLVRTQRPVVDLIYDSGIDTSAMKNVLLIHDEVTDSKTFITAANSDTFPVVYNNCSSKEALLQLLQEKFASISRIAFVFHNGEMIPSKAFLDNEPLFTNEDLVEEVDSFSNNMKFIIEISNSFHVTNLDFLACNTLQHDAWKTYYQLLEQQTQTTIGASDDLTGNLKYGGDWTLESTNEDIKSIYFTDLIENYQYTLATSSITQSGGTVYLRQNPLVTGPVEWSANNSTGWDTIVWPLTINNDDPDNFTLTLQLTTNITFSASVGGTNGYIIIGSNNIVIDGLPSGSLQQKVVTINGITNYPGLVKNGFYGTPGKTNITIQHIGVVPGTLVPTLAYMEGWICQQLFGCFISSGTIKVTNCYSECTISNFGAGGIFGGSAGYYALSTSKIYAENCFSKGEISGQGAGGIFGGHTGERASGNTEIYAINCYSIGIISGLGSGGIFGDNVGDNVFGGAKIYAKNCYSTGTISQSFGSGIFGQYAGYQALGDSQVYALNCYSTGVIGGDSAGGIFATQAGNYASGNSKIYAENCYSTGVINGLLASGIFGTRSGVQLAGNAQLYAINCYSTGAINGNESSGIFGSYAGESANTTVGIFAKYCYSTGIISGIEAGGIFASYIGYSAYGNTQIHATNCYTLGNVSGREAGGIFGSFAGFYAYGDAKIYAKHCYTIGAITGIRGGGIFGVDPGLDISDNAAVYANNCMDSATYGTTWVDNNASATIAMDITIVKTVWLDYSPLTSVPWLLKTFDATIYIPDATPVAVGTSGSSGNGLFLSTNYIIYDKVALPGTTINQTTGVLTSPNIMFVGSYIIYVLVGQQSNSNIYSAYNSNTYTFTVMASVPGKPTNVSVSITGTTTAVVTFTAPSSNGGSPITGYKAIATPVSGGVPTIVSQSGGGTSILMTGLTQGTTYAFRVVAVNSTGDSEPSDPVIANTWAQTLSRSGGTLYLRQYPLTSSPVEWSQDNSNWGQIVWPLTINNDDPDNFTLTLQLTTNITFSASVGGTNGYIIIGSNSITIDGAYLGEQKTVTINGISGYEGLIQNGTFSASGFTNITIQNVGLLQSSVICRRAFGKGISTGIIKVSNCYSTGEILSNDGGIFSDTVGYLASDGIIYAENCFSTGTISGDRSGGIFGSYTGAEAFGSFKIYARNCYSTGEITDDFADFGSGGGIYGHGTGDATKDQVEIYAENCYSTGNINDEYAGGIFGSSAATSAAGSVKVYAKNCYSNGNISGNRAGGIFGSAAGSGTINSVKVYATNCYSNGSIIGNEAGGIFGTTAALNASGNTLIYAEYCYTIGGGSTRGIFGSNKNTNLAICPLPINCRSAAIYGTTWVDDNASATIATGTTNVWLDYSPLTSVPWLLKTFNATIYIPNETTVAAGTSGSSGNGLFLSTDYIIYDKVALPETMINQNTGVVTSPNIMFAGSYIIYVLVGQKSISNVYSAYNSNTFTFIVVETVPGRPTNVSVTIFGTTTAVVTFTAPSSNGGTPITGYKATATPVSGGVPIIVSRDGSETIILMTGLTPETTYAFTVVAINSTGESEPSDPVIATTTQRSGTVFLKQYSWQVGSN